MSCHTSLMVIGCTHRPVHDEAYCKWIVNQVDEIKPDVFIHAGDLFDADCVGKFAKHSSPTLKEEYDNANNFLDELNHKLGTAIKVFIQGNHCSRIFRTENKHLSDLLDFRVHCSALATWDVYDYKYNPNHVYRLGQITVAHGFDVSKKGIERECVNLTVPYGLYIHAHTHRGHSPRQVESGGIKFPYYIANTGCGINGDVEYFQTKNIFDWNRGFLVGVVDTKSRKHQSNWQVEFVEHSKVIER